MRSLGHTHVLTHAQTRVHIGLGDITPKVMPHESEHVAVSYLRWHLIALFLVLSLSMTTAFLNLLVEDTEAVEGEELDDEVDNDEEEDGERKRPTDDGAAETEMVAVRRASGDADAGGGGALSVVV